ncbi:MAG: phosphoribosylanthranilate isomerase [Oscillospiraceae bacterium]|nr:phosphoribosylanthranilate isomerase [Oscillospiraceae bacterium]
MRIKICGLSRPEDIEAVNLGRPDYIGFVFAPSRRRVSFAQAEELKSRLHPAVKSVGVFAGETPARIAELLRRGVIGIAQLHGDEDLSYAAALRALTDAPIVKAIALPTPERVRAWEDAADYLLLDGAAGGAGRRFDWASMPVPRTPWFLAGGLNAGNLEEAARYRPFGLDISSGAETGGVKDPEKIINLIQIVRNLP